MNILFVCLGNICRSPMAEGIFTDIINHAGLNWTVDSAGTGNWHVGEPPDHRAIATCFKNGIDIRHLRGRQIQKEDFENFDLVLALDESNYANIIKLSAKQDHQDKVKTLLSYLKDSPYPGVPDPYFEGGFDHVFQLIKKACEQVAAHFYPDSFQNGENGKKLGSRG